MVSQADAAAKLLESKGLSVKIINVSSIKPIDREGILRESKGMRAVFVAEEHNVIGGLGSAVAEVLAGSYSGNFEIIGVNDEYGRSAENYNILLKHYKLDSISIVERVEKIFGGK